MDYILPRSRPTDLPRGSLLPHRGKWEKILGKIFPKKIFLKKNLYKFFPKKFFSKKFFKNKFSQKFFPQLKFSENLKFFFFKFFLNKNFLKKNHFKKFSPKFFTRIFPSPPNFILILQTVLQFKLISTSIRLTGLTGRTATL